MTNRISDLINKFQPPFLDIPIDKKEMHDVVERLYCLMYPISSQLNTESVQFEMHSIATVLLRTIAQLTCDEQANDIVEKFFESLPKCNEGSPKMPIAIWPTTQQPKALRK